MVARNFSAKTFLKISENSQRNTCTRASLIQSNALGCQARNSVIERPRTGVSEPVVHRTST